MKINIDLICPGCSREMELSNFYANNSESTTFIVIPCKCGIDYKKYAELTKLEIIVEQ